ncbi:ABC transporter substrate-binding protein [Sporomusa sp. KB1]|jgi:ABC-type nitrate/sulfonate/bicarbonate transport system substrate-binding protein|uniref:ABC transporter substrate-binding protein n=1 Tax=Sporomusa sp. KB1 TaxID=943346 RepID=UPI0011A7BF24|nr:ABC transporter substrate-binding protein [Sporomusa sp. KB1]TWH47550.1 ABC-type nitrate/sulfonate/bicarbonate transport system substrate-binding protein [Sporomusa sp. KB1]
MRTKFRNTGQAVSIAIIMILALSLLLAGCSKNQESKKAAADTNGKQLDIIRVPVTADVTRPDVFMIAEDLGYFAEEGIKLEYVGVIPSPQLVASVVAGKIDVGAAHINRTIAGISAGAKIKAVVAGTETTQEIPHMVYVTLDNSPIKNAQDMVGKKVGIPTIGGCNEYTPYAYLMKNGVQSPKGKIEVIIMPEANLEQALRQGDIDVAGFHKNPNFLMARGGLKILFTDYDVFGTVGGNTPFYFSEKFIKEKPDVVRRFVKAVAKANDWADTNQQQAIDITVKKANVDAKLLRNGYFAPKGIIQPETATIWIDLLKEFGEIKSDIKPEQIFTNEFNPYSNL